MASPEPSAVNAESSAAAGPEREGAVGEPPINRRAAVNPYAGAGREASSARLRAEADKSERMMKPRAGGQPSHAEDQAILKS